MKYIQLFAILLFSATLAQAQMRSGQLSHTFYVEAFGQYRGFDISYEPMYRLSENGWTSLGLKFGAGLTNGGKGFASYGANFIFGKKITHFTIGMHRMDFLRAPGLTILESGFVFKTKNNFYFHLKPRVFLVPWWETYIIPGASIGVGGYF
ncbi:MAG: hypothetical protein OEX02_01715 [Cyclobacteriaceae bacterium]|nr:hypothetical protein [Cyclobacteriaceae bacterium]